MITIVTSISNEKTIRSLKRIFDKLDAQLVNCTTGRASFLKILQFKPGIIIIELKNFTSQDISLIKLLRKNSSTRNTPLILFGPPPPENIMHHLRKIGSTRYLEAPFSMKSLLVEIQNSLQGVLKKPVQEDQHIKEQFLPEDSTVLFDNHLLPTRKISFMIDHIDRLVAFPTTFATVLRLTEDASSSAGQLGKAIESDPSVATEILRLANSVYFAVRSKRIKSVKEAIIRIGFNQTKSAVLSMSIMRNFKDKNFTTGFNHTDFWFHSLAVAIIAEKLSKKTTAVKPDEAFSLGLLHALGTLLFNEYLNTAFRKVLDAAAEEGIPFAYMQDRMMKVNHLDLMSYLFEQWKLSPILADNIRIYDRLDNSSEDLEKHPLALIVSLADAIAHSLSLGCAADCCVRNYDSELVKKLGLTHKLSPKFLRTIYDELNMYNSIVKISNRSFPEKKLQESGRCIISFQGRNFWSPVCEYLSQQGYEMEYCHDFDDFAYAYERHGDTSLFCIPHYTAECDNILTFAREKDFSGIILTEDRLLSADMPPSIRVLPCPVDLRAVNMCVETLWADQELSTVDGEE
ncbi:MAG: HDOD domain-containing protein [Fibrobacterota bacterium]